MIDEMGGLAAAKKLINDPRPKSGFLRLAELGLLDLTVEYVVAFDTKYRSLFTAAERLTARTRYEEYSGRAS